MSLLLGIFGAGGLVAVIAMANGTNAGVAMILGFGLSLFLLALVGGAIGQTDRGIVAALQTASKGWTTPILVRSYDTSAAGQRMAAREGAVLHAHGYRPSLQSSEGGHFKVGTAVLTGGVGLLATGSHTKGKTVLTYTKG